MSDDIQYIYVVEGLDLGLADKVPGQVRKAAMRAVNRATTKGRTASGRAIRHPAHGAGDRPRNTCRRPVHLGHEQGQRRGQ